MPASYPNSVKVFTTKTTGQTILASHINEPQDEITAIEQGLLQGLAHALFPNTDAGQDLGTTTKRWRNLLVQKIAAGITNATKLRIQEVGTSTWITVNADFDGTNWNREDTTQPAQGIEINNNKEVKYYRAAAGTNPITWTNIFTISTDRITASRAVIGTDPGGTEVLRAQNLRAGATTLTGTLTAPSAVVGTDPGGTEALRAQNLRAGATTLTSTLTAPTVVVGTDPGGTEKLRAENLRAGSTTITAGLSIPSSLPSYGTDPSVVYTLSSATYADRVAWTSAALHNIFASATNIVVETSDDGTTWTTGNADDFRKVVRGVSTSFTSQYIRFTFDVDPADLGRHIILALSHLSTFLTRVLRVERSADGGSTWSVLINDVVFSGGEQLRVFATSTNIVNKIKITLWATTWSAGNTHVLSWLCGTTHHPFRSSAGKAPRLGQPDGSTRPALMPNTDVVPLANNTYDIGTSALRWRSIYGVSGVFGTDPGGTESLRAGSARLNAPVLLGSVPQFTMAADPTAAMQVATKQYVDSRLGGFTNVVVIDTIGTHSWVVPSGVTEILVKCWGGGGGGGGARGSPGGDFAVGGGGGGGGYAEAIVMTTPNETLTITVGAGGSGGSAPSVDNTITTGDSGGSSSVNRGTTTLVRASGGGGGGTSAGTGGTGDIRNILMRGGSGSGGGVFTPGSTTGTFISIGGNAAAGGGISVNTRISLAYGISQAGTSGNFPGGGGSGALAGSGGSVATASGGPGAQGLVVIYY